MIAHIDQSSGSLRFSAVIVESALTRTKYHTLYKPGRPPDAPSYTGVKAGVELPGLPNTAGPGTEGSAIHA